MSIGKERIYNWDREENYDSSDEEDYERDGIDRVLQPREVKRRPRGRRRSGLRPLSAEPRLQPDNMQFDRARSRDIYDLMPRESRSLERPRHFGARGGSRNSPERRPMGTSGMEENIINPLIRQDLQNKRDIQMEVLGIMKHKESKKGRSGKGETGLLNLGNTCFMNSIIQSLSNTQPLAQYFLSRRYIPHIKKLQGPRGRIASSFSALLYSLHSGEYQYLHPGAFREVLTSVRKEFNNTNQHDAHEFLVVLENSLHENLDQVTEEQLKMIRLKAAEQGNRSTNLREAAQQNWTLLQNRSRSELRNIFAGLQMSTTKCLVCQTTSETFIDFTEITLNLPSKDASCTLNDCLSVHFMEEQLDDGWSCPRCKERQAATKQAHIWKLPQILRIHLSRFEHTKGEQSRKLSTKVNCQTDGFLSMKQFLHHQSDFKETNYKLYAFVTQIGHSLLAGHYIASCYNSALQKWLEYDDGNVAQISQKQINKNSEDAYILFFIAETSKTSRNATTA